MRALTWSFGGGTQSVAIAVLVAQGRLPRPDAIVIADTGREQSETWRYLNEHVRPMLMKAGLMVEVAGHELSRVDLRSPKGKLLIPAYTRPDGRMPTFCSTEWKKRVVQRWLRKRGYGPKRPVTTWIGFSLEEAAQRMKPSGVAWQEYAWPLVYDIPMTRDECRLTVVEAGLPKPPRSSCWMCPHHTDAEWRAIRDRGDGDWERAVAMDGLVRADGGFIHHSRQPLSEAPLTGPDSADDRDYCQTGLCFV